MRLLKYDFFKKNCKRRRFRETAQLIRPRPYLRRRLRRRARSAVRASAARRRRRHTMVVRETASVFFRPAGGGVGEGAASEEEEEVSPVSRPPPTNPLKLRDERTESLRELLRTEVKGSSHKFAVI